MKVRCRQPWRSSRLNQTLVVETSVQEISVSIRAPSTDAPGGPTHCRDLALSTVYRRRTRIHSLARRDCTERKKGAPRRISSKLDV